MFELTNEQRMCFALLDVNELWERIEIKASPYDKFKTILYINGDVAVKGITCGDEEYSEFELSEKVTPDRKYLLPKTSKGKPVLLSSANVLKRKGVGMCLSYYKNSIDFYNENTQRAYFNNVYLNDGIHDLNGFIKWIEKWCKETTSSDITDVLSFSRQERKHIRYQEGDVFRFKIGCRLYGYGRLILNYDRMRKNKEPFWDVLMTKPLVCSVYHIVTERDDVGIDELKKLKSLPSVIIADNSLYYGEFEIIGNLPVTDSEDYPIMYGNSIRFGEKAICYQCGKIYRKIENEKALYTGFINNSVSFKLNFKLDVLLDCIKENSNDPYWTNKYYYVGNDLRNPIHNDKLKEIKAQFGLK